MRKLFITTIAAGVLSLLAFVFERLALADIFHGEPDLNLEWMAVNYAFLPILLFHILAIISVIIALRRMGR
jgi:hypothetical protein